jgi:two-component system, NtrC family, sensor kinase
MRRHSRAGGKSPTAQAPKAAARKSRIAPKAGHRRSSSAAREETALARLTRERDEALEQQATTAEVLKALSGSTFDLQSVLKSLLGKAVHLISAEMGLIYRQDGDIYRVAASFGHSHEFLKKMNQIPIRPDRGSATGRAVLERRVVHIPDTLADADYRWGVNIRSEKEMHRTILAVPMLKGGAIIGVIVIRRTRVQPFTDKQIAVLSSFADQAIIAIENARLINELRERTSDLAESLEQQTATSEVLGVISRSKFELQPILQSVVDTASRLCRADVSVIFRLEGGGYRFAAGYSLDPAYLEHERQTPILPGPGTVIGRAAMSREVVQIEDAWTDPLYEQKAAVKISGGRSMIGVPLMREGEPIGVIGLARTRVELFSQREIELVATFADQAVIAIENTRLFEAEQQRSRELAESLKQQTATSDVLQAISRSAFDLEAVLNTLVESASRVCEADRGVIIRPTREGASYHSAASYGHTSEYDEYIKTLAFTPGRNSLTGRVLLAGKSVQIADVLADAEWAHAHPGAARLGNFRTMLGAPLLREGTPIGIFLLQRAEVRPFTEKQIKLVETFADQAVIAIENTRLFEAEQQRTRELTESLEQQTATSEVLQVISSSPGQLRPVFDTILDNAVRICESHNATLWLQQDGTLRRAARYREVPDAIVPSQPSANSALGRAVRTKQIIHIPDYRTDQPFLDRDQFAVAAADQLGIRTNLCVPMLKEGEAVGAISIYRTEVRPFTEKQIELIASFASQAVIAIENARLLNELRESLQQQTATADVLKVISRSTFDLQSVLDTLVESAARLCAADKGAIQMRDGEVFRIRANYGYAREAADYALTKPLKVDRRSVTGRVALEGKAVHIHDVPSDPEYRVGYERAVGFKTALGAPLLRQGKTIGVFVLTRDEVNPFTEKQIELVITFADQAVIAIENARLLHELRQSLEQQTATSKVLDVISRSAFDLKAVLEAVGESSVRLCGADRAFIYRFDGEMLRMAVAYNTPPQFKEFVEQNPVRPGRQTCAARAALERQTTHIPDILADPEYTFGSKAFDKIRTVLGVPMLKGDDLLGVIIIYRQEVKPFTQNQITLVETFADQAAIAIENVRLLDELRQRTDDLTESLEQQTATSEILEVISNSPTESQPAFDAIARSSLRLFPDAAVVISLPDGDRVKLAAIAGADADDREKLRARYPLPLSREYITSTAIIDARELDFADARETPVELIRGARNFLASGYRAITVIPMLRDDTAIGAISIVRRQPGALTEKQRELLRTFASQAVIAIENTRLFHELRARTDDLGRSVGELRALGEVSQAVNSTLDLETVLETIVANAVQLSGTEAGAIYVFNDQQREFRLRATYGMDRELIDALANADMSINEPNIALILAERNVIQVADLRDEATNRINEITLRAGFRARLIAPLIHGEEVVGLLVVRRRAPGTFPQNTIDLIKTFAAQSAVAIENARLFKNVETSLEDLRTAQDRLVQTQKLASLGQLTAGIAHEIKNPLNFVNNFSGVSAELIDELLENLRKVDADAGTLAEIAELTNTLRDNLDKIVQHGKRADSIVKNMLLHSREGSGDHRLVDANALVEEAVNLAFHGARAENQGFKINIERSLDPAAGEADVFPQEITRALLNLISNGFYAATKRHEQDNSERYEPTLTASTKNLGDRVEIKIRDNGTGIPPDVKEKMFNPFFTTKPAGEGTGLGLSICHDIIVKQHSGSIEVDSQPGEYTEVRIVLPRAAAFIVGGRA